MHDLWFIGNTYPLDIYSVNVYYMFFNKSFNLGLLYIVAGAYSSDNAPR